MIQSFNEWTDARIKMPFQEKYQALLCRLSTLNSKKAQADAKDRGVSVYYACGSYVPGGSEQTVEEIIKDIDLMWAEIKQEILDSTKDKKDKK